VDRTYDYDRSECSACGAGMRRLTTWSAGDDGERLESTVPLLDERLCSCGKWQNLRERSTTRCPGGAVFVYEEVAA